MTRSQLIYNLVLGIILVLLGFAIVTVLQLKDELIVVSQQLEETNDAFISTTTKPSHSGSIKSGPVQTQHNEIVSLQQKVAILSSQFQLMMSNLSDLQSERSDPSLTNALEPVDEGNSTAFTAEILARTEAESQALLDYALTDTTKHDPIWSDNTRHEIEQLFLHSPNFEIARDFNVTCGGQLCKIQTTLPKEVDFLARQMFEMNMMADLSPFSSRSITKQNLLADGRTQINHYIAREGHRLPTESPATSDNNADESEATQ